MAPTNRWAFTCVLLQELLPGWYLPENTIGLFAVLKDCLNDIPLFIQLPAVAIPH
jgi:hypothetical protein